MGVSMMTETLTSMDTLQVLCNENAPVFCVAHVANAVDGLSLSTTLPIRSVVAPPLLVVVDGEVDSDTRERLRLAGAAHVCQYPLRVDRDAAAIDGLRRSPSWFLTPIQQMGVTGVAELMATHGLSGMIGVACECVAMFSDQDWKREGPFRCIDSSQQECVGFYGRLYIRDGQLIHAESPTHFGKQAVAQMERVQRGTIRVQEMFIPPALPSELSNRATQKSNRQNVKPPPIPTKVVARSRSEKSRTKSTKHRKVEIPTVKTITSKPETNTIKPDTGESHEVKGESGILSGRGESSPLPGGVETARVADQETRETMKAGMNTLLNVAPNLQVAAKSDGGGNAIEVAGEGDGESVCAVTAMCSNPVLRIAELLGLGSPESWSIVTEKVALYVHQDGDAFVSVLGKANKNPDQILNKLSKAYQNAATK